MPSPTPISALLFPHGQFRGQVLVDLVRQQWFVRLRWIIVGSTLALLIAERSMFPESVRPWPVAGSLVALGVLNVVWMLVGRRLLERQENGADVGRVVGFVNAQMFADLLILTVLLRYSGGVENPMSMFYLFHVLMAALLLRPLNALLQGLWALVLFGSLAIAEALEWVSPHYAPLATTEGILPHTDVNYVAAALVVLAAGVFGTLYFTLQISARLDEQERDLARSNQALKEAHRAMEQLHARRSRFMQTAAHQLKSPLATIETLAGLLRDDAVDARQSQDIVRRIIARCRLGVELVSELLTLARVEEQPVRPASSAADLGGVVRRIADRFSIQAKARGIALAVPPIPPGTAVGLDDRSLEDCLANLVDNALKYSSEGGRVELHVERWGSGIAVSVADNGTGIARQNIETIFEPFCRGPLALAAGIPGTGLGLTIVREIAERAGGRIEVESVVGKGSRFTVRLPRAAMPGGNSGAVIGRASGNEGESKAIALSSPV